MPILEVKKSDSGPIMVKVCQACKTVSEIALDLLVLGDHHMAEAMDLPPCHGCGAVEILIRSIDASVPDHLSGHRKVVNAVANYLSAAGKVDASALAPNETLAPAAPVGDLYGKVAAPLPKPVPVSPKSTNPVVLAQQALAAAQVALAAALAAQKK